jgi:hypothetical protein
MGPIGVPEVIAFAGYTLIGYLIFKFFRRRAPAKPFPTRESKVSNR